EQRPRAPWLPIRPGPAGPNNWFGVVPATVRFERAPGASAETLNLVVKVNPKEGLSRTLIPWIVEHKRIPLPRPYWDYRNAAESDHTVDREPQVYRLSSSVPALRRILPRCYGFATDAATGEQALF